MSYALDGVNHNLAELRKVITTATAPLVKLAESAVRLADATEGLERRTARLEEAANGVEASNRRLAEAMERLCSDGRS